MSNLGSALARLGLSQYFERFIQEGFDTWETVLDITESDLEALGVKLGHRRRLQREIANSRGLSAEQPLNSPTRPLPIEDGILDREETTGSTRGEPRDNVGCGKRKYRRHPKVYAPLGKGKKAPGCWMLKPLQIKGRRKCTGKATISVSEIREDVKDLSLSFTEIAKLVGESWQILPAAEKESYEGQAQAAKERYNAELAEYKKTVPYRVYMEYLAEFKAKMVKDEIGTAHCPILRTVFKLTLLVEGKRPKLENHQWVANNPKTNGALPLGRVRVVSMSSVGTYDSVASGQTSPSTVNLHAPLLSQPPAVDAPLESPPKPTQLGGGGSTVPSRQQADTMENIPSVEDPRDLHPDHIPSAQQLRGILLRSEENQGPCSYRYAPSAAKAGNPVPRSPMQSNYDSSVSSTSSGYNTSTSSLYTAATSQEDTTNRIQRALPPPSVNSAPSSASQGCFDSRKQPAHPPGYQPISPPFQIPPLPSHTAAITGIKVRDSEEGPSEKLGNGTLTC
ncbi:hypothetical protein FGG08_003376 [Glutinoglossum americanum]|uniref:HMG box domain-containing protein n=1 Tax=Glutinoglossum americanum TaxID=1670608 RepID=A0A9P8HYI3_9PEZI|nr:hypothetical protein FGG08_003376 [Glutinoglossum americanum]